MRVILIVTLIFFCSIVEATAQCAMCRSTLENNFSNGDPGIAAGINTGILYLLVMPYLAAMVLAYCWYRTTRHAK